MTMKTSIYNVKMKVKDLGFLKCVLAFSYHGIVTRKYTKILISAKYSVHVINHRSGQRVYPIQLSRP